MGWVYALVDPRTDEVRYVGQTIVSPHLRWIRHLEQARNPNFFASHKRSWIMNLLSAGCEPRLVIFEECDDDEVHALECKWIAHYRPTGRLTNITEGGAGGDTISKLPPDRYEALCAERRARVVSEESRVKQAASQRRRGLMHPGTMKGKHHTTEAKAKIGAALKGRAWTPEHREKANTAMRRTKRLQRAVKEWT